jgi:hypothetical protein
VHLVGFHYKEYEDAQSAKHKKNINKIMLSHKAIHTQDFAVGTRHKIT